MTDTSLPTAVGTYINEHEADLLDLAAALVAIDTQNPPGRTVEAIEALDAYLAGLGLETERVTADPAKPNLLARLPDADEGSRAGVSTLCLNGHLDTVPYETESWTRDPLGEFDGDRLYGRGATDMKGAVAAMAFVAAAYAETDTTPASDLLFTFVSDEETGGSAGLQAVIEADAIEADACVIGETTCERGRHSVTVADRGSIWLTLEARGESAHGSRPVLGANAIDRLYAAIDHIRSSLQARPLDLDPDVREIVESTVEYYAPTMGEEATRALFYHPSVNLGEFAGGDAINTVPEQATARVDVRLAPAVRTPDVLADIRGCLDAHEGVTVVDVDWSVGTYESLEAPVVRAVTGAAEAVTGERIYRRSATGGGDAKRLREVGISTVEFGLGTDTVHAVDEYTTRDAVVGNARVYAALAGALASVD